MVVGYRSGKEVSPPKLHSTSLILGAVFQATSSNSMSFLLSNKQRMMGIYIVTLVSSLKCQAREELLQRCKNLIHVD